MNKLSIIKRNVYKNQAVEIRVSRCPRIKIELSPGVVKFFQVLIFSPENVKISKITKLLTVLNCYLAVNCPKPTPSPISALFQRGRPLLQGVKPPTPNP